MNDIAEFIDKMLMWFIPATLIGAGGGIMRAIRSGKSASQVAIEGMSGAFVAYVCGPVISAYIPPAWQYPCVFFCGWGGLELMGRLYEAAVTALEARIAARLTSLTGTKDRTGGGNA